MPFKRIAKSIVNDPSNAWAKKLGYEPIFTASEQSKIVIIGQAPGRITQESGIPWDDPSGITLREWLAVTDEEFYDDTKIALMPMDFYFPGKGKTGDLPPRKEFADTWHPQLLAAMPNIELTILIGQYAQKYYLGKQAKRNLTENVRAYKEYLPTYLPLVHSSPLTFRWRKQNPWFVSDVIPDVQKIVRGILG
jgi:uracil-DNA glycosylase